MENIKGKYGLIIGFVTLMILLSNLREELSNIIIDLGFFEFNLSDYYLFIVIIITLSLYLYALEAVFSESKIGHWRIFNFFIYFAYFIFGFLIVTPLIILVTIGVNAIINTIDISNIDIKLTFKIVTGVVTALAASLALRKSLDFIKNVQESIDRELKEEEIKELDNALKLYNDGYYSQSILETFKVLEIHLYRLLTLNKVRVNRKRFQHLLEASQKYEIIDQEDIKIINGIRKMRNSAAHLDIEHNKEQAENSINFMKQLLKRTAPNNVYN